MNLYSLIEEPFCETSDLENVAGFDTAFYINCDGDVEKRERMEEQARRLGIKLIRCPGIEVTYDDLYPENGESYTRDWSQSAILEVFRDSITPPDHRGSCPEVKSAQELKDPRIEEHKIMSCVKIGCTLSHQKVAYTAKRLGLKNYLIFEDDVDFDTDWVQKVTNAWNDLQPFKDEWWITYLGGQYHSGKDHSFTITENLTKINHLPYGTWAMAVNEKYFTRILLGPTPTHILDVWFAHDGSHIQNENGSSFFLPLLANWHCDRAELYRHGLWGDSYTADGGEDSWHTLYRKMYAENFECVEGEHDPRLAWNPIYP